MNVRTAIAAAALVAGAASFAPAAAAGNVAWNVTVGGPGFAVSAGQPWGWGGGVWGGGFRPGPAGCWNCGWRGPWVAPVAPLPIVAPAPVVAPWPVVVSQPVVVAPRRVWVAPRAVVPPRRVVYAYAPAPVPYRALVP